MWGSKKERIVIIITKEDNADVKHMNGMERGGNSNMKRMLWLKYNNPEGRKDKEE